MKSGVFLSALLLIAALGFAAYTRLAGEAPEPPSRPTGSGSPVLEFGSLDDNELQAPGPVRESPPAPAPDPVVVPAVSSVPTVEGALVREFSSKVWGDGNDFARVQGPGKDLTSTLESKSLNPDGKVPSEAQARVLTEILDKHTRIIAPMYVSEGKERKRALIAAVETGRFESAVVQTVAMGDLQGQERVRDQVREVYDGMRARLLGGMSPHDYIFAAVAHTGDGVARKSLVYVSRQNDPAYFQVSDALRAAEAARNEELKNYLRGL